MMETVQISFNYDPEILKEAGVDLDSQALNYLRMMMLEHIEQEIENLRENLRFTDHDPKWLAQMGRRLALIEAFTTE